VRILILDDDKEIRELLTTALTGKGHEVTAYADPTEFPFLNKESCPCPPDHPCADIIIADIVMPNIEGIEFLRKLREAGCHPIIRGNIALMSGYLTLHYMNDLNEMGVHYFRKPFVLEEIYQWVEQCRERAEADDNTQTLH